jgi:putative Mg2+ transporter-C (MgtC) family protein
VPLPSDDGALLLRLALATALAGAAGWDRERAGKAAGLRTHMLVGLAAALYAGLGTLAIGETSPETGLRGDPVRIIQSVAIGIGFLGGGAISVVRGGGQVIGLTTAASIWTTAAMGIACALGHSLLAAGATVLQIVVLRGFARFER